MARPVGSPNKKTLELAERLENLKADPVLFLTKCMNNRLGGKKGVPIEQRIRAALGLMEYMYPKRKSIDVSGKMDFEAIKNAAEQTADVLDKFDGVTE